MNKKIVFSLVLLSAFSNAENLIIGYERETKSFSDGEAYINRCFFDTQPSNTDWTTAKNYDVCGKLVRYNDNLNVQCIAADQTFDDIQLPRPSKIDYYALNNWKWFVDDNHDTSYVREFNRVNWLYMNKGKKRLIELLNYDGVTLDKVAVQFNELFEASGIYQSPEVDITFDNQNTKIDFNAYGYDKDGKKHWYGYKKLESSSKNNQHSTIAKQPYSNEFRARMRYNFQPKINNHDYKVDSSILQEIFQEYKTASTGRVLVNTSLGDFRGGSYGFRYGVLVYLVPQVKLNNEMFDFGDYILGNRYYAGVDNYNANLNIGNIAVYYLPEGDSLFHYKMPKNMYDNFYKNMKALGSSYSDESVKKYSEQLLLKNTRISPRPKVSSDLLKTFEYEREYQDKYYGGLTKCYTFDIKNFNNAVDVKALRMGYFNYNNSILSGNDNKPYYVWTKTTAKTPMHFSIHKSNGNRAGVYEADGKEISYSINARPNVSPKTDGNPYGYEDAGFDTSFYPDANKVFITDMANQSDRNTDIDLKTKDLDQVYIALQNNFISQDGKYKNIPARPGGKNGTRYYLTNFTLTKKQTSNIDGEIKNPKEVSIPTAELELIPVNGINGLGLGFQKDALYKLLNISKEEIDNGNVYEIELKVYDIVDIYGGYKRPLFQVSGKDIITGNKPIGFKIILGKGQMPKVTFGTAYNSHEDNGEVIKNGLVDTEIANKFYTRTNKQDIYLGFNPIKSYTLNKQYVKFFDKNANELKNIEVYNSLGKINIDNVRCKGYYPISGKMVVKLKDKLDEGQGYKFSYEVAEYNDYNQTCDVLGSKYSNEFTIRPEKIEYKVAGKDEIQKNAGKVDSKFSDNNVIFTSDKKDDRFGIGIAELRVEYAKPLTGEKTFNLEDKNTNLLNKVDNTTTSFVDFDKTKGEFTIKTVFPMVTDAKILLAENKFTHEDLKNGLCNNNDRALYKDEANKISTDGKINCQTPGNEIKVKFTASQSLSFEKDAANKEIKAGVTNTNFIKYVPFSDLDGERLRIPLQIANTNNGSYFYKKYDSNTVEAELNLVYADEPKDTDKIIISASSDLDVKATSKKNVFELSGLNDKFNDKLTALNIADKLSSYNDNDFDARNFAKLEYKIGYPKTFAGKPNLEKEFVISNANSKIKFITSGTEEFKNDIFTKSESYTFAYTGLFFKDIRVSNKSANDYNIESGNAGLLKYVENQGFRPVDNHNINNFNTLYNNAIGSFNLISDYSRSSLAGNKYEIPSNLKRNQYVKDTIRFNIKDSAYKYLDSFSTFTIEFIK